MTDGDHLRACISHREDDVGREAIDRLLRRVRPGATVTIETLDDTERTLTVDRAGVPNPESFDWNRHRVELTGYGTTYTIWTEGSKMLPRVTWPSGRDLVTSVTVDEPAPEHRQLTAERTAGDLFWRVDRFNGR